MNIWTESELDFLKANYKELLDREIADILQTHTEYAVATKRKKMHLTKTNRKYTFEDVIKEFNKRNYKLLSDSSEYKDAATNSLRYICPRHKDKGVQTISLGHLQTNRGCYYCGRERSAEQHRLELSKDIESMQLCQEKNLTYIDSIRKKDKVYVRFTCPKHPYAGVQVMIKGNLKREFIRGCRYCIKEKKYTYSKGESEVVSVLNKYGVQYLPQYVFDDCINERYLVFDFYLPQFNVCIEFDGEYHFHPVQFPGLTKDEACVQHEAVKVRDKIKDDYCKEKHITMLRIPYFQINSVEKILIDVLKLEFIA